MENDPAVNGLLALGRRYLETIRVHVEALQQLAQQLLKGEKTFLLHEEMRLGYRLDEAVYAASVPALSLLEELQRWEKGLGPEQRQEVSRQRAHYDASTGRWRQLMEAVHHVWTRQKPPQ
jgi:hypothetical protein